MRQAQTQRGRGHKNLVTVPAEEQPKAELQAGSEVGSFLGGPARCLLGAQVFVDDVTLTTAQEVSAFCR